MVSRGELVSDSSDVDLLEGEFITRSQEETLMLGKRLGASVRPGDLVLLQGELGAGKTVLAKGIADAIGISPDSVTSPSFCIANSYAGRCAMLHLDLYRLSSLEEVQRVGVLDLLRDDVVLVIEWAQNVPEMWEGLGHVHVRIEVIGPASRRVLVRRIGRK